MAYTKTNTAGRLLWAALLLLWILCPASGRAQNADPSPVLEDVRLGTMEDYSRLVFILDRPAANYTVRRLDVDMLLMDLGNATSRLKGPLKLGDRMVGSVVLQPEQGHLMARVALNTTRFTFRHFSAEGERAIVLDIRSPAVPEQPAADTRQAPESGFAMPALQGIALGLRHDYPPASPEGSEEAFLSTALDALGSGDYEAAITALEAYKAKYPEGRLGDPALYLLGESYYHRRPAEFDQDFQNAVDNLNNGLGLYPNSPLAHRAMYLLGMCYNRLGFVVDAMRFFNNVMRDAPDSIYGHLARLEMGALLVQGGKLDEAQSYFDQAMSGGASGQDFIDKYYLLGKAYFDKGLYSEANAVFKQILKDSPDFYLTHPEILYFTGEGYYHLSRPDLAREYLYHSLNLDPEQAAADIILARIGDTYKDQGRVQQAAALYDLDRQQYPDSTGALISQLRMADLGAVSRLFAQDDLFQSLEEGVNAAMLGLYRKLLETDKESPLLELAMFKMALALEKEGQDLEALNVVKRMFEKYPQGSLRNDARRLAGQAFRNTFQDMNDRHKFADMVSFYDENKDLMDRNDWPEIRHQLGMAYAALNQPKLSNELLEANRGLTDHEDERLYTMGRNYLALDDYDRATKAFTEFRQRFPQSPLVADTLVSQGEAEVNRDMPEEAVAHLEEAIRVKPQLADDAHIQNLLGKLYLDQNRLDDSVTALRRALELQDPNKEDPAGRFLTYSRLGQALATLGRQDEAAQALDEALKSAPDDPTPATLYLIADTYRKMNMMDRYEQALMQLAASSDVFWSQAAFQELKALSPDKKVEELLNKLPPQEPVAQ